MTTFNIEHLEIGESVPPLVIPEIGIIHNGSLEIAKLIVILALQGWG